MLIYPCPHSVGINKLSPNCAWDKLVEPDITILYEGSSVTEDTQLKSGDTIDITILKNQQWGASIIKLFDPEQNLRFLGRRLGDHEVHLQIPYSTLYGVWLCAISVDHEDSEEFSLITKFSLVSDEDKSRDADETEEEDGEDQSAEVTADSEGESTEQASHLEVDVHEDSVDDKPPTGEEDETTEPDTEDTVTTEIEDEQQQPETDTRQPEENEDSGDTEHLTGQEVEHETDEEDKTAEYEQKPVPVDTSDEEIIPVQDTDEPTDNADEQEDRVNEVYDEDETEGGKPEEEPVTTPDHDLDTSSGEHEETINLSLLPDEEQQQFIAEIETEDDLARIEPVVLSTEDRDDLEIPIAELEEIEQQYHNKLKSADILYIYHIIEMKPVELRLTTQAPVDQVKRWLERSFFILNRPEDGLRKEYRRIREEYAAYQRQLDTLIQSDRAQDPISVLVGVNEESAQRLSEEGIETVGDLLQVPLVELINLEVDPQKPLLPKLWIANAKSYVGIK